MTYLKATAETIHYENTDVICASGECPGHSNNQNEGEGMGCKGKSSGSSGSGNDGNCNGTNVGNNPGGKSLF